MAEEHNNKARDLFKTGDFPGAMREYEVHLFIYFKKNILNKRNQFVEIQKNQNTKIIKRHVF